MATIAELTLPAAGFPLGRLFTDHPEAEIELDRVVPSEGRLFPYFWVRDAETDEVLSTLEEHALLESVALVDTVDDEGLFQVVWKADVDGIVRALVETDVALLSGVGTADRWTFELRATSAEALSTFQRYCRNHDVPITPQRVRSLEKRANSGESRLTEKQRDALTLAFHEGYYDDTRRITLESLAETLGITRPSVSSRLRRGHRNLIGSTIVREQSADGE